MLITKLIMAKEHLYFFTFVFCWQFSFSQAIIRGRVTSEEAQKPVSSVSVYLNNTSIGTSTNEQGIFVLKGIPPGKFRLIVSCIGFATYDTLIDTHEISGAFIISLKRKPDEMMGVAVLSDDPNGWEKWGRIFTDIFIGTTPNSNDCHLENPKVLKFRLNSDNTLTVYASKPLQVINSTLGYEIRYKLEEFEFNMNMNLVNYSGYAFFKDLELSNPKKALKYEEERREIYTGSLLHFMRAFFSNQLTAEGFELRNLGNISNPEKDRAKKMIGQPAAYAADSSNHFKKILRQPDSIISHQIISADSIRFTVDSTLIGLYFKDSLEVSFKLKAASYKYKSLYNIHKDETFPVSQFVFINRKPVYVLSSGYYYMPFDLKMTGYWAWWENMSTKLPYDYSPVHQSVH
jgi:hypothetical protein